MRWVALALLLCACSAPSQEGVSSPPSSTVVHTTTTTTVRVVTVSPLSAVIEPPLPVRPAPTTLSSVPDYPCPEWVVSALDAGWSDDQLDTVQYLIDRESRCDPMAHNPADPRSGSYGLMQINGHWCQPNPSYGIDVGWLQENGVLSECSDLYDPSVNLSAGFQIWTEYGFEPWGL